MKPSKYNIFIPGSGENEFLVFNARNRSCTTIRSEIREILESPLIHEDSFQNHERDRLQELSNKGMILSDESNEDLDLEKWFHKLIFDNTFLDITLLTTYECNLRCTYCNETGLGWGPSISRDTCRFIILWIVKRLDEVKPGTLRLVFAGGEPLINFALIRTVSEELYYSCKKRNINIEIRLITNGTLLTEDIIEELNNFGLRGITVTFDGDETIHDTRRRFKDGNGSFHAVVRQMQKIKGRTPITVCVNFNSNYRKYLPHLLDHLTEAGFSKDDIVMFRFKPIQSEIGKGCRENMACTYSGIRMEDFLWLKKECSQRQFATSDNIELSPCEAIRENNYVIDPDGKIFKCAGFAGRDEFIIGDIRHDESLMHVSSHFLITDLWQKCRKCPYVPVCGGGCRVNSQALWGNILGPGCETEYQDRVFNKIGNELTAL